jgi:hypothetical protein
MTKPGWKRLLSNKRTKYLTKLKNYFSKLKRSKTLTHSLTCSKRKDLTLRTTSSNFMTWKPLSVRSKTNWIL